MASIYEVADRASVSITTVSHVFSGRRPVAPETRRRVLLAASQLNYQPSHTAKGLATGRSMILGVHFPYQGESIVQNPYFPELLDGLSLAAAKAGYGFLLIPEIEATHLDLLNRIDGAIVVDPIQGNYIIEAILAHELPIVSTGRYLENLDTPWVDNDNKDSISQAFAHLDEQGYCRPFLLSTALRYSYIEDIESGYREAAESRGIPARILQPLNISELAAYQMAREALGEAKLPDAIIAATDHQAIAVLRAARELGIRVPQDLGIIGAGDTVLAHNVAPSLTSIRVQPRLLGEGAVELMFALLNGDKEKMKNRLIPAKLVARGSTRRIQ